MSDMLYLGLQDDDTVVVFALDRGHVRQAGGDSRLKMRRHGSAILVESRLRSVHRGGIAIDGMADCAATGGPLSSPAPFGAPLRGCGA